MEWNIVEARCTICDPSVGMLLRSPSIEKLSETESEFIQKKIRKIMTSSEMKKSTLKKESMRTSCLAAYLEGEIKFDELNYQIAEKIYDKKIEAGKFEAYDLIVTEATKDGCHFIAVMDCCLKRGYTHHVEALRDATVNRIIEYKTILSSAILRQDNVFFYDINNETVLLKEEELTVNNEKQKLFSQLLFPCQTAPSEKEVVAQLNKTAKRLTMKYDLKTTEVMPALKTALNEKESFDLEAIAASTFEDRADIRQEFVAEIKDAGIDPKAQFNHEKLKKRDKMIKFVTENGIEIAIPAEYMRRTDKVEIINNPDGTLSIEIKHISALKNRGY